MISNKDGLEHLAQIFIQEEITDIVISPGSRNAPMMLTFPEYEEFNIYSIVDERSAGFFALGLAQKTRQPVVLNCTSGSALLNYAPAIAEAYYQQIPLIVLSADRPSHLIDHGDGQAINQKDVYHNFIRKSVHLPENFKDKQAIMSYQKLVLETIAACKAAINGPVHINIPLDEPIYQLKEKEKLSLLALEAPKPMKMTSTLEMEELLNRWDKSTKRMIIIGQHLPEDPINQALTVLNQNKVVVLCESSSNMPSPHYVSHIDQVLSLVHSRNEESLSPEIVISLGGHIVSKKIKAWLRNRKNYEHWHISLDKQAPNTFFHLSKHIQREELDVLGMLQIGKNTDSKFHQHWMTLVKKADEVHHQFIENIPFSDLLVFSELQKAIPEGIQLHFSNSTPIRYSQLFDYSKAYCIDSNRGVSGIDGSVSTALGQSLGHKQQSLLITGDLSFFYDQNALWNNYIPTHFKILLINNGGGGIFRFIDGPMKSGKMDLFETPHQKNGQNLALDAGMEYSLCTEKSKLSHSLKKLIHSKRSHVLEVFTPREINDQVLKDYFNYLSKSYE